MTSSAFAEVSPPTFQLRTCSGGRGSPLPLAISSSCFVTVELCEAPPIVCRPIPRHCQSAGRCCRGEATRFLSLGSLRGGCHPGCDLHGVVPKVGRPIFNFDATGVSPFFDNQSLDLPRQLCPFPSFRALAHCCKEETMSPFTSLPCDDFGISDCSQDGLDTSPHVPFTLPRVLLEKDNGKAPA